MAIHRRNPSCEEAHLSEGDMMSNMLPPDYTIQDFTPVDGGPRSPGSSSRNIYAQRDYPKQSYQELRHPNSCEAGFEYGGVDSGEIGLKLHLDGKSGTVYVSAEMLGAILDRAREDGFTMPEKATSK